MELDKKIDYDELESIFKSDDAIMKEMYLDAIPKQKKMILDAPSMAIVVFKPKTRVENAKTIFDLNCLVSVWTYVENFLLSLSEHDVYGVTFIQQNIDIIKKKIGIPDELEIATIIPIGYKSDNARILKHNRINVIERIHYENW